MKAYTQSLAKCSLFIGIPENKYPDALSYLHARCKTFKRGEIIMHIGDEFRYAGLVLDGEIECSYQDEAFNKYNMNHFAEGELFGEAMACAGVESSPMQVIAVSECVIMFLDLEALMNGGELQAKMSWNLTRMLSLKNVFMNQKVRILSTKSLRDRITAYLHTLPDHDGVVTLSFSKTALAEFLCVNRTALSRELARMCREGIISMNGRRFVLRQ